MTRNRHILFAFLLYMPIVVFCQDLHSSNYDYNPMYINPAEAGGFLGTIRIHASHRDQFDAFIEKGFNRQIAQVDMPLNIKFLKKGWTGYGLGILNDKSGDLGFKNTGVVATLAYHYPLDRKNKRILAVGVQIGRLQRGIRSSENAMFGDVLAAGGVSPDFSLIDQFAEGYTNYNIGVSYKSILNKRTKFNAGISVFHTIGKSQITSNNRIWRRYNAYASVPYLLNNRVILEPRIYASLLGSSYNINLQTIARFNYQNKIRLSGGLGYRVQDALQVLMGVEYKGWDIGISYDVTVSSARRYNNGQGALELGIRKIFVLTKTPKIDLIEICPRL